MRLRRGALPPVRVTWGVVPSPAGKLAAGMTEKGEVCLIAFLRGRKASDAVAAWKAKWPRTAFSRGVDLKTLADKPVLLVGTPFQYAVWRALAKIPAGRVCTYGDIARRLGKAGASRAVGAACGANPVPFLIPCHRVVATCGLGGFSGGLEIKKALLKAEGKKRPRPSYRTNKKQAA